MKRAILGSLFVLLPFLSGCAIGPVNGLIFTSNAFPGEFNPANDVKAEKTGEGCQRLILGLVSFGNAGAGQVAHSAGITRIATIDHSTLNVLQIVYSDYCTIVRGE